MGRETERVKCAPSLPTTEMVRAPGPYDGHLFQCVPLAHIRRTLRLFSRTRTHTRAAHFVIRAKSYGTTETENMGDVMKLREDLPPDRPGSS
ncbi:Hypothetical protein NTJ_03740 [Nesidiocoris tenuis]|uniref:Uncharacterized protein n=1 Tax=Nesidiocoris tenuis TaxID=355587 RepID=A0ABN7AI28_9HEMI|nr:Hypothetical protein NTJ_03740 [Nesidiocoris tenuis]